MWNNETRGSGFGTLVEKRSGMGYNYYESIFFYIKENETRRERKPY